MSLYRKCFEVIPGWQELTNDLIQTVRPYESPNVSIFSNVPEGPGSLEGGGA